MSWSELRDLDEWRSRLGVEGRVEIQPRRWLEVGSAALMLPIGAAMVAGGPLAEESAVGVVMALIGLIVVLASVAALVRGLRPGPVLVVDAAGLHFPLLRLDAPWSAVLVVGALHARNFSWLDFYLDPSVIRGWRGTARVGWYARRQVHDTHVQIHGLLEVDKDHLATWLQEEADRRRRFRPRPRP